MTVPRLTAVFTVLRALGMSRQDALYHALYAVAMGHPVRAIYPWPSA